MTDTHASPHEPRLDLSRFDVLDCLSIPLRGERMVLLRAIEEAMSDLAADADPAALAYLIKLRPRPQVEAPERRDPQALPGRIEPVPDSEPIYLSEGKLNFSYLARTAELLIRSAEYRLARNIYVAIAHSGERTGMALYGIARCLEGEGKPEEARARYEESIAYLPDPEAYRRLATLLIALGRDRQAAEVIERALQIRELSRNARFELCKAGGGCLARTGRRADAGRLYFKALEIRPDSDEIHCAMGALHLEDGRIDLARSSFERSLELNPSRQSALTGLGRCALAQGDLVAAETWFARALQMGIRDSTAIIPEPKGGA